MRNEIKCPQCAAIGYLKLADGSGHMIQCKMCRGAGVVDERPEATVEKLTLSQRVARLERRLEIDKAWIYDDETGERKSIPIPPEDRDGFPDAVECRDATIKLLEDQLAKLGHEHSLANQKLSRCRRALEFAASVGSSDIAHAAKAALEDTR